MKKKWFHSIVLHGAENGRKIGFPTVNLYPSAIDVLVQDGVYSCFVQYSGTIYRGALYIGPQYVGDRNTKILEIHILQFNQDIYGEFIEFQLDTFIRPPLDLKTLDEVMRQIQKDLTLIAVS